MKKKIPNPIISLLSDHISTTETHATLTSLFMRADAPTPAPAGSKHERSLEWFNMINEFSDSPLDILGSIVEKYIEDPNATAEFQESPFSPFLSTPSDKKIPNPLHVFKNQLLAALSKQGLTYINGGSISDGTSAPTKTLESMIKGRNFPSINREFERALENIAYDHGEAVLSACNILESIFKTYIQDESLKMPSKLDVLSCWKVIRDDLGFNPSTVQDDDLKQILSGIASTINGIAALRSHASAAHAEGRWRYNLEARHARLAINSAHTIATFVLESWDKKKGNKK